MNKIIISTIGTSLLNNYKRTFVNKEVKKEDVLKFMQDDQKASAETNSLSKLELEPTRDQLYFFRSNTEEGKFCAETLVEFYQSKGFSVVIPKKIKGMSKDYNDFQERGLSNLFNELAKILSESNNQEIIINATGGYKAQVSFAMLFGNVFGVKVVYLHEDFKRLIAFPPMPVACDLQLIDKHRNDFNEVLSAPTKQEARRIINTLPRQLQGFFEKNEGDTEYQYTAIGKIFCDTIANYDYKPDYKIRTFKEHTSLWGDGINNIGKINDAEVRELFMRIFKSSKNVREIYLDETFNEKITGSPYMEYVETFNNSLRYKLFTKRGSEFVKVIVDQGTDRAVLGLIGKKIKG